MALTNAQHQAATRERRKQEVEHLRAELESLRSRPSGHAACDELIEQLRREVAALRRA